LIEQETQRALDGKSAAIMARMNSISEPEIIEALYRASRAGVSIDLIVRGICCLRPGVPGISENIRVRSVLGRFLEHSRVFYFHAGGKGLTYCSSADWMPRNLHRRVETCFPIENPSLRERVLEEGITTYLDENVEAWILESDGHYRLRDGVDGAARNAQDILLAKHAVQRNVSSNPAS
jgi:polyphosphate kinase